MQVMMFKGLVKMSDEMNVRILVLFQFREYTDKQLSQFLILVSIFPNFRTTVYHTYSWINPFLLL